MKRRGDAPRLRVKDLKVDEELALALPGWSPGSPTSTARWTTWGEYLDTYGKVRDELRARLADDNEPFAELVRRFTAEHGLEKLEAATYEQITGDDDDEHAEVDSEHDGG